MAITYYCNARTSVPSCSINVTQIFRCSCNYNTPKKDQQNSVDGFVSNPQLKLSNYGATCIKTFSNMYKDATQKVDSGEVLRNSNSLEQQEWDSIIKMYENKDTTYWHPGCSYRNKKCQCNNVRYTSKKIQTCVKRRCKCQKLCQNKDKDIKERKKSYKENHGIDIIRQIFFKKTRAHRNKKKYKNNLIRKQNQIKIRNKQQNTRKVEKPCKKAIKSKKSQVSKDNCENSLINTEDQHSTCTPNRKTNVCCSVKELYKCNRVTRCLCTNVRYTSKKIQTSELKRRSNRQEPHRTKDINKHQCICQKVSAPCDRCNRQEPHQTEDMKKHQCICQKVSAPCDRCNREEPQQTEDMKKHQCICQKYSYPCDRCKFLRNIFCKKTEAQQNTTKSVSPNKKIYENESTTYCTSSSPYNYKKCQCNYEMETVTSKLKSRTSLPDINESSAVLHDKIGKISEPSITTKGDSTRKEIDEHIKTFAKPKLRCTCLSHEMFRHLIENNSYDVSVCKRRLVRKTTDISCKCINKVKKCRSEFYENHMQNYLTKLLSTSRSRRSSRKFKSSSIEPSSNRTILPPQQISNNAHEQKSLIEKDSNRREDITAQNNRYNKDKCIARYRTNNSKLDNKFRSKSDNWLLQKLFKKPKLGAMKKSTIPENENFATIKSEGVIILNKKANYSLQKVDNTNPDVGTYTRRKESKCIKSVEKIKSNHLYENPKPKQENHKDSHNIYEDREKMNLSSINKDRVDRKIHKIQNVQYFTNSGDKCVLCTRENSNKTTKKKCTCYHKSLREIDKRNDFCFMQSRRGSPLKAEARNKEYFTKINSSIHQNSNNNNGHESNQNHENVKISKNKDNQNFGKKYQKRNIENLPKNIIYKKNINSSSKDVVFMQRRSLPFISETRKKYFTKIETSKPKSGYKIIYNDNNFFRRNDRNLNIGNLYKNIYEETGCQCSLTKPKDVHKCMCTSKIAKKTTKKKNKIKKNKVKNNIIKKNKVKNNKIKSKENKNNRKNKNKIKFQKNKIKKKKKYGNKKIEKRKGLCKQKQTKKDSKIANKKRKQESKIRKKQIKEMIESKNASTEERSFFVEFCKIAIITASKSTRTLLRIPYHFIVRPRSSWCYVQDRATNPKVTLKKVVRFILAELNFMKMRLQHASAGSTTINVLKDTVMDTKIVDAFRTGTTKQKKEELQKERKKRKLRIKRRRDFALHSCNSGFLITLRKTPCMWFYHILPKFYPQCVRLLLFFRNFVRGCLIILALCFWTPCIVAVEVLRGLCCCMLCSA